MELNYGDIFGDKTGARGSQAGIPSEQGVSESPIGDEDFLNKINHIIEGINQLVINYRELKGTVGVGNPTAQVGGQSSGMDKVAVQQVVADTLLQFVKKTRESLGKSPLGQQKVGQILDMVKDLSVEQAFNLIMYGKGKAGGE